MDAQYSSHFTVRKHMYLQAAPQPTLQTSVVLLPLINDCVPTVALLLGDLGQASQCLHLGTILLHWGAINIHTYTWLVQCKVTEQKIFKSFEEFKI